ncbi:transglutaminase domain-containing protein [Patescibacteria group bacterium]|nr:transglutaminase domain-containing protein [Patescibacteria group bacterium]
MKNLTGYLRKILSLSSLVLAFFLLLLSNQNVHAAEDQFTVTADFTHGISDTSIDTEAIITIASEKPRVVSYFTTTIPQENISVECYSASTAKKLDCSSHSRAGATDIQVDFNNSIVKPTSALKLRVTYHTTLEKTGALNIVSSVQDAVTKSVVITYPKANGEPLWTSDTIQNIKSVNDNYQITILKPIYSSVSVLFGKSISYQFTISKTFSNTLKDQNQTFELIVPSDSTTQTIIWDNLTPLPNIAEQDEDGNYIFKYILAPEDTLDCNIQGHILKRATIASPNPPEAFLTTALGYWKTPEKVEFIRILTYLKNKGIKITDSFTNIQDVDADTQQLILKYIYQYTVERLNPQKSLTSGVITDSRVGFDNIVANPNEVNPSDYTDFLITILRKYGIPSRQVIGYVSNISGYTSDGFYNYWVEAYDTTQQKWITMDPFLEDYSSKPLYGNAFFDHIAILKRGKSPVAPKLTFYKDSDFKVTSSSEDDLTPELKFETQFVFENSNTLSKYLKGLINVSNTGNIAINEYNLGESNIENIKKYVDPVNNINSQIILPKQTATLQLNVPNSINTSNVFVNIEFSNEDYSESVLSASDTNIKIPIYLQIITKAISVLSFVGIAYLVYFLLRRFNKKQNG